MPNLDLSEKRFEHDIEASMIADGGLIQFSWQDERGNWIYAHQFNKEKQLYRVSNALINKDKLSLEKLKHLLDRLALIEAEKYNKRILHGSWSVGNISIDGNLIDFDTAYFVKERNPQYSNTNKYKSNYFGFELLGSKMIGKLLYEAGKHYG